MQCALCKLMQRAHHDMVSEVADRTPTKRKWQSSDHQNRLTSSDRRNGQCGDRFRLSSKLDRDCGEVQVNTFLYALASEAETIYDSFVFGDGEEHSYSDTERIDPALDYMTVITKFSDHFVPKRNVIHDTACFHRQLEKPGEKVKAFDRSLYELAQYCEFKGTKDEQIRDRIVIDISDNDVSQKL